MLHRPGASIRRIDGPFAEGGNEVNPPGASFHRLAEKLFYTASSRQLINRPSQGFAHSRQIG